MKNVCFYLLLSPNPIQAYPSCQKRLRIFLQSDTQAKTDASNLWRFKYWSLKDSCKTIDVKMFSEVMRHGLITQYKIAVKMQSFLSTVRATENK